MSKTLLTEGGPCFLLNSIYITCNKHDDVGVKYISLLCFTILSIEIYSRMHVCSVCILASEFLAIYILCLKCIILYKKCYFTQITMRSKHADVSVIYISLLCFTILSIKIYSRTLYCIFAYTLEFLAINMLC